MTDNAIPEQTFGGRFLSIIHLEMRFSFQNLEYLQKSRIFAAFIFLIFYFLIFLIVNYSSVQ